MFLVMVGSPGYGRDPDERSLARSTCKVVTLVTEEDWELHRKVRPHALSGLHAASRADKGLPLFFRMTHSDHTTSGVRRHFPVPFSPSQLNDADT